MGTRKVRHGHIYRRVAQVVPLIGLHIIGLHFPARVADSQGPRDDLSETMELILGAKGAQDHL